MNAVERDFPDDVLREWQDIINLVVRLAGVRAGLIMRIVDEDIAVLISSNTENNPYRVGDRERLADSGLYCETVIKSQDRLLVVNALDSDRWNNNPDLKYGLSYYLGFPIRFPDGNLMGTICLLDDKENAWSPEIESLMSKMRDLIEGQLQLTEEYRLQRLFASKSFLRSVLDNLPMAIVCGVGRHEPRVLYINEEFVHSFGYAQSEISTMDQWFKLFYPDEEYRAVRLRSWADSLENMRRQPATPERKEFRLTCKDGRIVDVLCAIVMIEDLVLVSFADITDRKRYERELLQAHDEIAAANAELKRLATTDLLTDTGNRRHFEATAALEMLHAQTCGEPVSLLLLDVDHFKSINDRYGHSRGDQVLVELCRRLRNKLGLANPLARWGGEEFSVLLPQCDVSTAASMAEELRELVSGQPFPEVDTVTISCGVAQLRPAETREEWFKRVDAALYNAKSAGRNAVRASA
ncbi:MAG: diguanylate cyclase [Thiohalocapsa sp.]|uniref:GGDEF domain-containing protein n=1 Tax=Thiohalocapsa sp. TaxID=2497641 RepID=UPI0025F656A3|nr:diguanylate cyclase [Thiohalocapsa sp.]MCG6943689.1 diguanylate cyclase [Thiohalocapsa sp.]